MATNFLLHSHRHVASILKPVAERYAIEEALQAAIRESERCENYRGDDVTGQNAEKCNQPGPLCLNDECGMCESCGQVYSCPNASEHDFGK